MTLTYVGDTESWEQQEGLEESPQEGRAGRVTTKQKGLEVSPGAGVKASRHPSVTPAPSLSIFVKVLRLEQSLPSLSPSPALAGIIKTPRDGCKLLDVFIKTNQSIFPCGIISLRAKLLLHRAPAPFGSRCRPLPAISLDYPRDVPLL